MNTPTHAPELLVQTWFNTDRPLQLSGLRGRVVVLAVQVLCPKSIGVGIPQAQRIRYLHGLVRKHTFGAVDDLRIGAEIGALTQESGAEKLTRGSAA